jgi:rhamnose utilization protein RhaD (predicted bifunctional aldolase and dehydrogenase)
MIEVIKSLIEVAHTLGRNPAFIQGGGGNVSQKVSATEMLVKASGFRLDDITIDRGLVPVHYEMLRAYYQSCNRHTDLTRQIADNDVAVTDATIDTTFRPSIETGFHAILDTVVLHSHAVTANILTCSNEGQDIITSLFPEATYIPYYTPGIALTLAILEVQKKKRASVFFLENHGIITTSTDATTAHNLHDATLKKIEHHLDIPPPNIQITVTSHDATTHRFSVSHDIATLGTIPAFLSTLQNTVLFPDQAVYTNHIDHNDHATAPLMYADADECFYAYGSAGFAQAAAETLAAWIYIYETIHQLGFTHRTLSLHEGNFIANLDSEKYRKKIA